MAVRDFLDPPKPCVLVKLHELAKVHDVVPSPEMQAIKKEIASSEYNDQRFFGSWTSQDNNTDTIKEAVGKIPIPDTPKL